MGFKINQTLPGKKSFHCAGVELDFKLIGGRPAFATFAFLKNIDQMLFKPFKPIGPTLSYLLLFMLFCFKFYNINSIMPYPCSGKNLISNLVTDYIQKRRGEPCLFSSEYNLIPKLISNFYHYMDQA